MTVLYAHPRHTPHPEMGGNSYTISFSIEKLRLYAYFFFITLIIFAYILFNIIILPIIEAGAPEGTPVEQLGCGPFNRVSTICYPSAAHRNPGW
jgi:hypothetical protein